MREIGNVATTGAQGRLARKRAHGLKLLCEEPSPRSKQLRHVSLRVQSVTVAIALVGEGRANMAWSPRDNEHALHDAVVVGRFAGVIHEPGNW